MRRILCCLVVLGALGAVAPTAHAQSQPATKRCVGDPPRQTEDPMSLPCIPYFDDDNGGDLSPPSVTAEEIRVLLYFDYGAYDYEVTPPPGTYIDLDAAPKPACPKTWPAGNPFADRCDNMVIRAARAYGAWGNDRYQTFSRRVHLYAYFTGAGSAASRRADAAENWESIRPFAVLDLAQFFGFNDAYDDAMAARGVTVVATPGLGSGGDPLEWTFWPDVAHMADLYAGYTCRRVAPFRVAHSGNAELQGLPRKFGLWYTSDPGEPALRLLSQLVKVNLRSCGILDSVEASFSSSGFVVDNSDPGIDAISAAARFRVLGVTTVLWLGGVEGKLTHTMDSLRYYPEIVFLGDLELDTNSVGRLQNQSSWSHAWGTQAQLRLDHPEGTLGYRFFADGGGSPLDGRYASRWYRDYFTLFQAVQVGGALISAQAVYDGFHAVPTRFSTDPYTATCFFDEGDTSCVKDAMEVWWDPIGLPPGGVQFGCLRMVAGGRRYLAGAWPSADSVFGNPSDPCTSFEGRPGIRL